MGVLGPVVIPHSTRLVAIGQTQIPGRSTVRSQLVGDNGVGPPALVPQQFPQQSKGCGLVPAFLDQQVEDLALVVHGPPEKHPLAADLHDHFVQVPPTCRLWPAPSEILRKQPAELLRPAPDGLVTDLDAPAGSPVPRHPAGSEGTGSTATPHPG